jgi:DNA recombination protein RmuC
MEALGNQLDNAKTSFEKAMGQLYTGRDNLIKQAGQFESLGVSIQTQLPEKLVEKAALELDYVESQSLTFQQTKPEDQSIN